jgi:hypothetical protein
MIKSYYASKECERRETGGDCNPYKQRFWWAMQCDNYLVVDRARERCKDRRIGQAYVKCWQTEEKEELCNDFKNYVTILKRFEKPVSAIGLNDWLDEHFNNVQNWCVRYWKPSRVEIVYRRLFDDNNIVSDPHVSDRLLWTYWNGEYYSKDD